MSFIDAVEGPFFLFITEELEEGNGGEFLFLAGVEGEVFDKIIISLFLIGDSSLVSFTLS